MTAIFHDMVEDFMEVFMDDFSVFGNSVDCCIANLDRMLARCEETNLVLNWEKCHSMVKEGIILGHKISRAGIEVDRAKIDVIAKLPYPTNVKGVRSFLGHAGFYRRFIKDFSMISKPMTQLMMKDAKFDFSDDCKKAFNILKEKLTTAPIIISPDWNEPFELMCDASDFTVGAYLVLSKTVVYTDHSALKGAENLAADHLSRLENLDLGTFTEEEITNEFPDEHLMIFKAELNNDEPWYADYINYIVGKIIPPNWTPKKRMRFFSHVKYYFWDEPYVFKLCSDNVMRRCVAGNEIFEILAHCHSRPTGGYHSASITGRKVYEFRFYWPSIFKDAKDSVLKSVGYNPKNWSEKLDDALWAFRTVYKTPTGCTPFRLVYGKAYHLPVEIEHKAYWAFKQCNMGLTAAAKNRFMELNELIELRDEAYENTRIYKERTKKWHDSRLRGDKYFKEGDKVLIFNSKFKMHPGPREGNIDEYWWRIYESGNLEVLES
ncbi:reverse transcriptase domain-containing protein [Tanacetum coccineum]